MLKSLRKNAKQILWPLTIAMIIAMGGYGVWYLVQPEAPSESEAGVIWGRKITLEEFLQAARASQIMAWIRGQPLDQKQLYSQAWERIILKEEAQRLGVTSDRKELSVFLARLPLFQTEGRFNRQHYLRLMQQWRIGEVTFEELMRDSMAIDKLRSNIWNQALVSEAEIKEIYERFNEKVKVEYVEILKETFREPIDIPEFVLNNYYEQNKSQFQIPPQVEIQYILIPRESFEESVEITPEEVKAYYQDNQNSFADEEGNIAELPAVREEILIELVRQKADDAVAARAREIDRMLSDITDLKVAAEKFALPVKSTGPFFASEPVPGLGEAGEINRAAFAMQTGEISYPVPLLEGTCFFQLLRKEDSHLLLFEEVRERIQEILNEELTNQEALKVARDELSELRQLMVEKNLCFSEAVEELGLKTITTHFFTREVQEDIPPSPIFVSAAFLVPLGEVSDLVPTPEGYAFLHVLEREPAEPLPEEKKKEWKGRASQIKAYLVYNEWLRNLIRESRLDIKNPQLKP